MRDNCENGYERIERFCHVVGKNTAIVRRIWGEDRTFVCENYVECKKNGGCKNCMCKNFTDE